MPSCVCLQCRVGSCRREVDSHSYSQNCTLTWLCFLRADEVPTHRRCVHVVHGLGNERNIRSNALIEHPNHGTPVARPTIVSAATAAHVCFSHFRLKQAWAITLSLFADTSDSPASNWHEVQLNIPKPERPYICWCQCNRQPTYTGDNNLLGITHCGINRSTGGCTFPACMMCIPSEAFVTAGAFVPSWNKLPEHHVGHGSVPGKLMGQAAVSYKLHVCLSLARAFCLPPTQASWSDAQIVFKFLCVWHTHVDCCCCFMQSGQGALSALNPNTTASTVMYGTSASSLTSMASGTSQVSFF